MSNVGKSYLSQMLSRHGFFRYCCDDLIEEKLSKELKERGFSGINDVAKWMGQPYDHQYAQTSNKYLTFETSVMKSIITKLKSSLTEDRDTVVDTTASVIYTDAAIMDQLADQTTIIYLDTPESVKNEMYASYLANPKPVIWGDSFTKQSGESDTNALARCYPDLLSYRTSRYKKYAHITLEYDFFRRSNFRLGKLLDVVHKRHLSLLL